MTDPRQLEKLLGGYAAGTLTEEERRALCAAALKDQDLFDALMREQPLREVLEDPAARAELAGALENRRSWRWWRVAAAAGAVACTVSALLVLRHSTSAPPPPIVAQIKPPAPPPDALVRHAVATPEPRPPAPFPRPAAVPENYTVFPRYRAAATPKLALTYSVVQPAGDSTGPTALRFVPDGTSSPRTPAVLRFIPNDDGYLYIADGPHLIVASPVERLKPYTTPPLDPAVMALSVLFARQPQAFPRAALDRVALNFDASSGEGTAVARDGSQPLFFVITLRAK